MGTCFSCKAKLSTELPPARGAECAACGADIKVCRNCRFYDPTNYNECAEPNAERVVEKERANFCEYFEFSKDNTPTDTTAPDPMAELKRLFGDK